MAFRQLLHKQLFNFLIVINTILNKNIVFLVLTAIYSLSFAQNETNNWYFGDFAGLDFNQGDFAVLQNSSMSTIAGSSSISDHNGDLLFYTNGETIWNNQHVVMTNGNNLAGNPNNTQSTIIVPDLSDENIYYVFTTRLNNGDSFNGGLHYSKVEFSVQNPMGLVTQKNIRLTTRSAEKVTAVHNTFTNSINIITFGSFEFPLNGPLNQFFIFNVDQSGVNPINIVQANQANIASPGAMKISPNGRFLAIADFSEESRIYIYEFNAENSTLNYLTQIYTGFLFFPIPPYGLEFSPNSEVLYFSGIRNEISYLFKYKMNNNVLPDKVIIRTSTQYNFGSLQLASNSKIYVAQFTGNEIVGSTNFLSVINDPDNGENDSDFDFLSINLGMGNSFKGLPNFVTSYFKNRIIIENQCVSDVFNFELDAIYPIQSVLWEFGDGQTSTNIQPVHQYALPGEYTVKATITINDKSVDLYKKIIAHPLPNLPENQVLSQCDPDNDGRALFNLYAIEDQMIDAVSEYTFAFYNTLEDATNQINPILNPESFENQNNPQQIFVQIENLEGCTSISNFFIEATYVSLGEIAPMFTCENSDNILNNSIGTFNLRDKREEIRIQYNIPETSTISFYSSFEEAQTATNSLNLYFNSPSTTIWLRIENEDNSCSGIEPVLLIVNRNIIFNLEEQYTLCFNNDQPSLVIDGQASNSNWQWRNSDGIIISTNRFFEITQPGNYSLTVTNVENGLSCTDSESFTVVNAEQIAFEEVTADDFQIKIVVNGSSSYQFSLDNINFVGSGNNHIFSYIQPGIYTVYVRDIENCESPISTLVSFIAYSKFLTPNNDGYNDVWNIIGLSTNLYNSAEIEIYDRFGKFLYAMDLDSNAIGWDGSFNGKRMMPTDYWFKAKLVDKNNNVFFKQGHFSLKY